MPSFDVMNEVNWVEVHNAIDQANKEIGNRFDFKGSDARIELTEKEKLLVLFADNDFQLDQVWDIAIARFAKRAVDIRCMERKEIEKISGNKVKRSVIVKAGIDSDLAKKLVKLVKDSKIKVQAAIQGDTVRISGAKRDHLQETIAMLKKAIADFPLQFGNFRD